MDTHRLMTIIVMVTAFLLVFSIWCICVVLWLLQYLKRVENVQKRLGLSGGASESEVLRLWRESHHEAASTSIAKTFNILKRFEILRDKAGWKSSVSAILLRVTLGCITALLAAYAITNSIPISICICLAALLIFWSFLEKSISRHADLLERQLVDALGIAARALRAGHPLVGTFQLIADEINDPLGNVFARICQEQALGSDLKDSIRKVADTTYNSELKLFATAVSIQSQSGGNLADLMDRLTMVIRARMKLNRRVRVITAQTQLSKKVLIGLPILLFFVLSTLNPKYMEPFYVTSAGRFMLVVTIMSVLLGAWMMNKLSKLRY